MIGCAYVYASRCKTDVKSEYMYVIDERAREDKRIIEKTVGLVNHKFVALIDFIDVLSPV